MESVTTTAEVQPGLNLPAAMPGQIGGSWGDAGVHEVRIAYGNAVLWHQFSILPGKVWFE